MKKVTKVLLVLASSFVITGCKSNIHVLNDAESSEMLKELRKGFKLTAIIKQEAHYLSGYQGDETGEIETNTLKLTTTFDNISDTRGYECSYGTVSDNRYYEAYNTNVYEGEDGYAMS